MLAGTYNFNQSTAWCWCHAWRLSVCLLRLCTGLRGSNVPWFMCWFRRYITCLFVWLLNFLPYFLLSSCFLSYLFTSLLVYFLTYLSTPSRIDRSMKKTWQPQSQNCQNRNLHTSKIRYLSVLPVCLRNNRRQPDHVAEPRARQIWWWKSLKDCCGHNRLTTGLFTTSASFTELCMLLGNVIGLTPIATEAVALDGPTR